MQLVAYRNTERSARYTAAATEEQRLASQVSFMERRKAELAAELKTMVKAREKAVQRLAYERKMAEAEMVRQRMKFAEELAEHEMRLADMLSAIAQRTPKAGVRRSYSAKFEAVARRMCRVFDVPLIDLLSDKRDNQTALCRQAFCYWATRLTGAGVVMVGKYLDRDHATVSHGRRTYVAKRAAQGRTLREVR